MQTNIVVDSNLDAEMSRERGIGDSGLTMVNHGPLGANKMS